MEKNASAPPPYPGEPAGLPYPQPQAYPQQHAHNPGNTFIINTPAVTSQPTGGITIGTPIMIVGGCPSCRVGVLQDSYGFCAICLAICFFPLGVLCCLAMKEKQCSNCGAQF